MSKKTKEVVNENILTLKNYQLKNLVEWLHSVKIRTFEKSRARNRVLKVFLDKFESFTKGEEELLNKHGKKDKGGKALKTEDGKGIILKNPEKYTEDLGKLLNEKVLVDILPSLRPDLKIAKDVLKNLDLEFNYLETQVLEEILTAFDVIK